MALRINTNVTALKATRNLNVTTTRLSKSLNRLSTGLKINSAADGASALVISEKQKAQIGGLAQAMENTDRAISMIQTAEGAFSEINSLLLTIRNKAVDSKNTGVYEAEELQKNQDEINRALEAIDQIVSTTQFGNKKLLDGSVGTSITVTDGADGLDMSFRSSELSTSSANVVTVSNTTAATFTINNGASFGIGTAGTPAVSGIGPTTATLNVVQASAAAVYSGNGAIAPGNGTALSANATFSIILDGGATTISVTVTGTGGEADIDDFITNINGQLTATEVVAGKDATGTMLTFTTKDEGSAAQVQVASLGGTAAAELGLVAGSATGTDSIIELNGSANTVTDLDFGGAGTKALSDGSGGSMTISLAAGGTSVGYTTANITGVSGDIEMGGSAVSFSVGTWASVANAAGESVEILIGNDTASGGGNEQLTVVDNSLTFQIGANAGQSVNLGISSTATTNIGQGVSNNSGFASLSAIDITDADKADDAIRVIDQAITDVLDTRAELGAFQANMLETTMNSLGAAYQNLQAANSVVVDTDFSAEVAEFTKQQILAQSGVSVLTNANQLSQMALLLLG